MQTKMTDSLQEAVVSPSAENGQSNINHIQSQNTQVKAVKPKVIRRKFSKPDKLKILAAFDSCNNPLERGSFLRKEGLYYSGITKWRDELSAKNSNHANSKSYKSMLAHNQIMRENTALKKKLAQAEAIIDLQKKVSELLSVHVLNQNMSEE